MRKSVPILFSRDAEYGRFGLTPRRTPWWGEDESDGGGSLTRRVPGPARPGAVRAPLALQRAHRQRARRHPALHVDRERQVVLQLQL